MCNIQFVYTFYLQMYTHTLLRLSLLLSTFPKHPFLFCVFLNVSCFFIDIRIFLIEIYMMQFKTDWRCFGSVTTVAPRIDRTNLAPIVVKAGLSVNLDVKIIGEPPPEVVWLFAVSIPENNFERMKK